MTHAARLERVVRVTLRRIVFSELLDEPVSLRGVV